MADAPNRARFDAAQQDPDFTGWVAMNDAVLELEFDDDVPDLPPRPWGAEALNVAEQAALERFDDMAEVFQGANATVAWRFVRFLGQVFVDAFGGEWVNVPDSADSGVQPAVRVPFDEAFVAPIGLLTSAVHRRTGSEWSRVFGYAAEDFAASRAE